MAGGPILPRAPRRHRFRDLAAARPGSTRGAGWGAADALRNGGGGFHFLHEMTGPGSWRTERLGGRGGRRWPASKGSERGSLKQAGIAFSPVKFGISFTITILNQPWMP